MAVKREKTKKGVFYVELGSFKNKTTPPTESLEEYYRRVTPGTKKAEQAFNMFIEYHLGNGIKKDQLRLDRTVIEFGRRKRK